MINETPAAVAPDGFNVSRNFAEFQERYPTFIRDVFRRCSFVDLTIASVDDLTSGGALWIATLPADQIGSARGCRDRIEAFNPGEGHFKGATAPRFFHYIKRCLMMYYMITYARSNAA
jgi:hypothetical protein